MKLNEYPRFKVGEHIVYASLAGRWSGVIEKVNIESTTYSIVSQDGARVSVPYAGIHEFTITPVREETKKIASDQVDRKPLRK